MSSEVFRRMKFVLFILTTSLSLVLYSKNTWCIRKRLWNINLKIYTENIVTNNCNIYSCMLLYLIKHLSFQTNTIHNSMMNALYFLFSTNFNKRYFLIRLSLYLVMTCLISLYWMYGFWWLFFYSIFYIVGSRCWFFFSFQNIHNDYN